MEVATSLSRRGEVVEAESMEKNLA
jgi:hypothetical protein